MWRLCWLIPVGTIWIWFLSTSFSYRGKSSAMMQLVGLFQSNNNSHAFLKGKNLHFSDLHTYITEGAFLLSTFSLLIFYTHHSNLFCSSYTTQFLSFQFTTCKSQSRNQNALLQFWVSLQFLLQETILNVLTFIFSLLSQRLEPFVCVVVSWQDLFSYKNEKQHYIQYYIISTALQSTSTPH